MVVAARENAKSRASPRRINVGAVAQTWGRNALSAAAKALSVGLVCSGSTLPVPGSLCVSRLDCDPAWKSERQT
jgi:hypothetical protein